MECISDPSMVLYLPLFRMDGASFMSGDAYGHTGISTGTLWTLQGTSFDGIDDIITIPDSEVFHGMNGLSVLGWIRFDQIPSVKGERCYLCVKKHNGDPWRSFELVFWETDNLNFAVVDENENAYSAYKVGGIDDTWVGNWKFVSGIFNQGGTVKLYLDNTEQASASTAASGAVFDSNGQLAIGAWSSGVTRLDGMIGELLIYNRAITVAEMVHIYQITKWRYQ